MISLHFVNCICILFTFLCHHSKKICLNWKTDTHFLVICTRLWSDFDSLYDKNWSTSFLVWKLNLRCARGTCLLTQSTDLRQMPFKFTHEHSSTWKNGFLSTVHDIDLFLLLELVAWTEHRRWMKWLTFGCYRLGRMNYHQTHFTMRPWVHLAKQIRYRVAYYTVYRLSPPLVCHQHFTISMPCSASVQHNRRSTVSSCR